MSKLDINAPWIDPKKLPTIRNAFDNSRDPLIKLQKQNMEKQNQGRSDDVPDKPPSQSLNPPTPSLNQELSEQEMLFHYWLKRQMQEAMLGATRRDEQIEREQKEFQPSNQQEHNMISPNQNTQQHSPAENNTPSQEPSR